MKIQLEHGRCIAYAYGDISLPPERERRGGGGVLYCRRTLTGSKSDDQGHVAFEASSGHDNVLTLYSVGGFLYYELKMSITGKYSKTGFEFDCASVPQAFIPTRMRLGIEESPLTIFQDYVYEGYQSGSNMYVDITLTASGTVHASIRPLVSGEYTVVGKTSSLPSGVFVGGTEVA